MNKNIVSIKLLFITTNSSCEAVNLYANAADLIKLFYCAGIMNICDNKQVLVSMYLTRPLPFIRATVYLKSY